MENLVVSPTVPVFADAYRGKRVLVTGHTGFKGAWLCEWLFRLGAKGAGFSQSPPTSPALFDQLGLASRLDDHRGDVRDLSSVEQVIRKVKPEFIFHLAAQPLVRLSYRQPAETYATNIMGTVNVLEAVRRAGRPCVVVAITTDKCYENREWTASYREEDRLGGHDPYSSSKGAAELVIEGYRRSFFSALDSVVGIASARAGNVIGGGDWALDRIVPDCIRALQKGAAISVRNPAATRPWQHVLEPLSGYLWLGARIASAFADQPTLRDSAVHWNTQREKKSALCSAFNFGPPLASNRTVGDLVSEILKHWPGCWEPASESHAVHEARLLNLATDKAHHVLGWGPVWSFEAALEKTVTWYRQVSADPRNALALTAQHIENYTSAARASGLAWAARGALPADTNGVVKDPHLPGQSSHHHVAVPC